MTTPADEGFSAAKRDDDARASTTAATYTVETRTDESFATMYAPRVLSDHGHDLAAAKRACEAYSRHTGPGMGCRVARMSASGIYAVLLPDGTWTDSEGPTS